MTDRAEPMKATPGPWRANARFLYVCVVPFFPLRYKVCAQRNSRKYRTREAEGREP